MCPDQRLVRLDICPGRFSLHWAHTLCCFLHRVAQINKDQATDLVYWSFNLNKSFSPKGAMTSYNGAGSSAILIFFMYFLSHKISNYEKIHEQCMATSRILESLQVLLFLTKKNLTLPHSHLSRSDNVIFKECLLHLVE